MRVRRAFTLIELLVVVAIVTLLLAILLPSLRAARDQARRMKCQSNIRQVNMACIQHAEENKAGVYILVSDTGSDNLAHVFPKYLPDHRIALCPSTDNIIRTDRFIAPSTSRYNRPVLEDLTYCADNRTDSNGGHSYEIWGWYDGASLYPDGTLIDGRTRGTVNTQLGRQQGDEFYVFGNWINEDIAKKHREVKQPSRTLLALENDQGIGADVGVNVNNWPDGLDNHAPQGMNIGFLDGHVRWFDRGPRIIDAYLYSYADPPGNWAQEHPGLRSRPLSGGGTEWYYE